MLRRKTAEFPIRQGCLGCQISFKGFQKGTWSKRKGCFIRIYIYISEISNCSGSALHISSFDAKQMFCCVFCDGQHKPQYCRIVTKIKAREDLFRKKGLCFYVKTRPFDENFWGKNKMF